VSRAGWAAAEDALDAFLVGLVDPRGPASAAVGLVARGPRVLWQRAAGVERLRPRAGARLATRFDLASITKPVVATLALLLDRSGELPLRLPVAAVWLRAQRFGARTLEDLLRHRAGLPAWAPLRALCRRRAPVEEFLLAVPLDSAAGAVYSDLGYILWGFAARRILGSPPETLLAQRVHEPLGLASFGPPPGPRQGVAVCELDASEEERLAAHWGIRLRAGPTRVLHGRPHDDNARLLGGVPGHSGLFGDAADLWRFGLEWLRPRSLLRRAEAERAFAGRSPYALGWFRRRVRGSAGPALGPRAFGLPGFPGGSLWVDPDTGLVAVLLAHRRRGAPGLNPWRRRFHALAAAVVAAG
jgi:CubicO group peptidase (beta-lactamase class C family)